LGTVVGGHGILDLDCVVTSGEGGRRSPGVGSTSETSYTESMVSSGLQSEGERSCRGTEQGKHTSEGLEGLHVVGVGVVQEDQRDRTSVVTPSNNEGLADSDARVGGDGEVEGGIGTCNGGGSDEET